MADDVAAANRALLIEINDCLERAFAQQGKGSGRIVELTDALIAAVRAETFTAGFAAGAASIDKYGEQHDTPDEAYQDYQKRR